MTSPRLVSISILRTVAWVCAALLSILFPVTAAAAGKAGRSSAPAGPEEPVYYYNGGQRVELSLALDELEVETADPDEVVSKARGAGLAVSGQVTPGRRASIRLAAAAANRAGLKAAAARLASVTGTRRVRAVFYAPGAERKPESRQFLTSQLAVKLLPGQDPTKLAARHGLTVAEKVSYSPDTYILEAAEDDPLAALEKANTLYETEYVEFSTPMIARRRFTRALPADPLFSSQWHLRNTGAPQQYQAVAGNDVNAAPAWDSGITGDGVNIGVTDDGLQMNHPDLTANIRPGLSIDINYGDNDPTPQPGDTPSGNWNPYLLDNHGTAVAGVAAARANNGIGGVGAAYRAGLAGIRLISDYVTDSKEAQAMLHKMDSPNPADRIHINTNSWGPSDDGRTLEAPGPLTRAALARGAREGRGGRGIIYVWAGGNGRNNLDNVNFDGYASDQHTIAVGASNSYGRYSYYSDPGASLMVNAPSSDLDGSTYYGIVTTDRTGSLGYTSGDYTTASGSGTFGGTSSAAPLVAGCIALMLEANPNLTWRDVQQILVETSTKNDPSDSGWFTNAAGYHFNHNYGFGRINAAAAVEAARTWVPLMPRLEPVTASRSTAAAIPDNNPVGVSQTVNVTAPAGFRAEHVEVTVNITHTYRGDLEIFLVSPSGTEARLANIRGGDNGHNFNNWTFLSLPTWGEDPNGTWTLRVADRYATDIGTLNSWTLKVYGTIPAPKKENAFASANGWSVFGTATPEATATFDPAKGALLATVAPAAKNRVIGWRASDTGAMLLHTDAGTGSHFRARFWIYAGGQTGSNSNNIPNFRLRASTRFAATSILDVLHHSSTDLTGNKYGRDFRPSKDPAAPSLYRLDYAPVNVPLLHAPGSQEGVSLAFEAYSLSTEPQENGYLALTEASLGAYPAPPLEYAPEALIKTYSTQADFSNSFYYSATKLNRAAFMGGDATAIEAINVNGSPYPAPGGGNYPFLPASEVLAAVTPAGVTLDSRNVSANSIAVVAADFLAGNSEDSDLTRRARIEPGKQYHIRFHATSTAPASSNAMIRFRVRTAKFQWTQRLEVGGAFAAGAENNAIAQQMLPGTGSLNPDKITPGEAGGWYTVIMHSPLAPEIRSDFAPGTPLTASMPNLTAEPGPGVNAASYRDIFPGLDMIDTLSTGASHGQEQGSVTVDRIEIRKYDLVND